MTKTFRDWCEDVHDVAVASGWHNRKISWHHEIGAQVGLIHSEASEALEEVRVAESIKDLQIRFEENGKPAGFVVEMADIVIRVMDTCEQLGLDLPDAMEKKNEYNKTRERRHGGKFL